MRFSTQFQILRSQSELDFVDIPLDTDIRVFIDPYALATTKTLWSDAAHALACDFFQRVLDRLRAGDYDGARALVSNRLGEDNRTRLGYSVDNPDGHGLGDESAAPFLDALANSEAFKSGRIEDIEDSALFVERIGFDIVSDMLTNVIREHLANYTQDQCRLHGVPMTKRETFKAWRQGAGWTDVTVDLPTDGTHAILLVPRSIVRKNLSLQPGSFLTDYLDHYIDRGSRRATESLERMLQGRIPKKKRGKVRRKDLRDKLKKKGSLKRIMARLTEDNPEVLKGYKERARQRRTVLTPAEIESIHPQRHDGDISALILEMRNAAQGSDDVMNMAQHLTAAMVSAFHPTFQHPRLLQARTPGFAGVVMSNTASTGMMWRARHQSGKHEQPNVVVLASPSLITTEVIQSFDAPGLRASESAGAVVLVGANIDRKTRNRRHTLAKSGILVMSISELADIAEVESRPGVSLSAFESLFTP